MLLITFYVATRYSAMPHLLILYRKKSQVNVLSEQSMQELGSFATLHFVQQKQ